MVPQWSRCNSTRVLWWCLIGQDIIPQRSHSGASWLGLNSMALSVGAHGGASVCMYPDN